MEKIELRKARDFGQLFNDSIAFLRLNFKSFFGTIFFLAGPFVLLTGMLTGFLEYVSAQLAISNRLSGLGVGRISMFAGNSPSTIIIYAFILLLTTLVANATIAIYFKLYDKTSVEELPIQRKNISSLLSAACWRLFYNILLLIIIMSVFGLALVAVFYLFGQLGIFQVIVGLIVFVTCIILIPALVYIITVANFIVIRDEILITAAIGKTINYLRGNFWQTWIFIFCTCIALGMLYFIFNISLILNYINLFTRGVDSFSTNHSVLSMVLSTISLMGRVLIISPILTCFCIFNFYNQEERHEGTSLMNRIDTLDKN